MKKLKFKIFVFKHRKILAIFFTFIVVIFLLKLYKSYNLTKITNDPTTFSVIATLLGAVIGGVFTLLGSIWVNKREQKSVYNLRRKNIIYSPLYDELINIKCNILEKNQYPGYIDFGIGQQTIIPHPQYSAWDRIKNDTRYLEVPLLLKDQMEKLYDKLREYISIRNSANAEIKEIVNKVLVMNGLEPSTIINLGDVLSSDILQGEDVDIFNEIYISKENCNISKELVKKINLQVLNLANELSSLNNIRRVYILWMQEQDKAIEILSLLIKEIMQKYEG
ncbi:hypothetical protein ACWOB1_04650 [Facklamia languida]|uniref:Uncharacterized protein n=1 Tax=Facklamia languida CCUG 37842 TaxID=883113 RepID=H3NJ91_9LACT|nr:hypothetical protein [Facklamia languida]EHR37023.1 hypothetical protein HMPREF9708_00930 [Facklamia languida CCUG 37842]